MEQIQRISSIPFPDLEIPGFKGKLRDYQKAGVSCMALQPKFLLADDMGCGKTVEAIAACSYLYSQGKIKRVLVVCPSSVTYQWREEIESFTDKSVFVVSRDKMKRRSQYSEVDHHFFTVLGYKILHNDYDYISRLNFDTLIFDEATAFKNHDTQIAKVVKALARKAKYVYSLTGTPIQNTLMELHSIMETIDPDILGSYWSFRSHHCIDKEITIFRGGRTVRFKKIIGYRDVDKVVDKILPYFIKRRAEDVIDELPPVVTKDYWLGMNPKQKQVYKELVRGALHTPQGEKRVELLTKIIYMLECCDSPYLLGNESRESTKIDEIERLLTGELEGKKVVVFSRFKKMWELLEAMFHRLDIKYVRLIGEMNAEQRNEAKTLFQTRADVKIIMMSEAGEMGLNLTRGEYLICVDQLWNPERMRQLEKRLQRIGQVNDTVFVINLWVKGSVEEHVRKVLMKKRELINQFDGKSSGLQLSEEEMMDIIKHANETIDSV